MQNILLLDLRELLQTLRYPGAQCWWWHWRACVARWPEVVQRWSRFLQCSATPLNPQTPRHGRHAQGGLEMSKWKWKINMLKPSQWVNFQYSLEWKAMRDIFHNSYTPLKCSHMHTTPFFSLACITEKLSQTQISDSPPPPHTLLIVNAFTPTTEIDFAHTQLKHCHTYTSESSHNTHGMSTFFTLGMMTPNEAARAYHFTSSREARFVIQWTVRSNAIHPRWWAEKYKAQVMSHASDFYTSVMLSHNQIKYSRTHWLLKNDLP